MVTNETGRLLVMEADVVGASERRRTVEHIGVEARRALFDRIRGQPRTWATPNANAPSYRVAVTRNRRFKDLNNHQTQPRQYGSSEDSARIAGPTNRSHPSRIMTRDHSGSVHRERFRHGMSINSSHHRRDDHPKARDGRQPRALARLLIDNRDSVRQ